MPAAVSRRESDKVVRVSQAPDGSGGIGAAGVDLLTHDGMLSDFALRRGERVRSYDGALTPALGPKRIGVFTQTYGARVFGTTGKYAKVTGNADLVIPYGGFAYRFSLVATRAGAVGYYVSCNTDVAAAPVLVRLQADGTLTVGTNWDGGGSSSVTTSALTDGSTHHGLVVYDADAGTYTLYLDGDSSGTPVTGLGSSKRPVQTVVDWYFGVTYAAAAVASPFAGSVDAFTLFSFAGIRITDGSPSLLDTLRAHVFRQWPNPMLPMVMAQYDFDEASGSVLYDRSRHKNHGVYTGASTPSAAVAYSYPVGNYVGVFRGAGGVCTNLAATGGVLHYEQVRRAG